MVRSGERILLAAAGIAAALVGGRGVARALSNPNDFCIGDPCVIAADLTVDAGAVLDFGTRTVVLQSQLTIADLPTGGVGSVTIKAGTFRITGIGVIKGASSIGAGGSATIQAVNNIQIDGTSTTGAVRLTGQDAGVLTLQTSIGSISGSGRINLSADGYTASGGTLTMISAADINYTGSITAPGGTQAAGGDFSFSAAGDISLSGFIDLTGGQIGGGYLDVTSGGNSTFGQVDMSGSSDGGDAGLATFVAGGNITFSQLYRGRGSDSSVGCGDGADVDVTATGDVTLAAEFDIRGRGLDCTGGFLTIDARNVYLQGVLEMSGTGTQGDGGDLDISATAVIQQTGTVWLDGGDAGAGDLLYVADGNVDISGTINAYGRTVTSAGSTLVEIDGSKVTVSGVIDADGGASALNGGGAITLDACDVDVQPSAILSALGDVGNIFIIGSDSIRLRGQYLVGATGEIDIQVNAKSNPPNTTGAVFAKPPVLIVSPLLIPCRVCDTNAQCADTNDCTDDVCDPATGCSHTVRASGPCSDGNACTGGDQCVAGVCVSGPPVTCDDHNPCTYDACFPGPGCVSFPTGGTCDDGDLCTTGDSCSTGSCVGTPINCNDNNACTTDTCSGGVCSNTPNSNPCSDGNACTVNDTCSSGLCVGGPPATCNDGNICTTDTCNTSTGCQHTPIVGCSDIDLDGKLDDQDECTTIVWTPQPTTPPNQNPRKFGLIANKLSDPDGEQTMLIKGEFNMAPNSVPFDPSAHGVQVHVEDGLGTIFDVSVPGGAGCGPDDGWRTLGTGVTRTYKYRNKTNALPPGCAPGSALGVQSAQVKDGRTTNKRALQFKVKAKLATLQHLPALPLTRLQVSVALGARPSPTTVSPQAEAGQCAEALFTGNPIQSINKPYCRTKLTNAQLDSTDCKGL